MQTCKKPQSASRLIWQSRNRNQRRSPRWPPGIEKHSDKNSDNGKFWKGFKGSKVVQPLENLVEPMGVEPTASRVRFQLGARHHTDTARKLSQIKTHVAECRCLFVDFRRSTALVHGQNTDNFSVKSCEGLLIAYLMTYSNPTLHKIFSTTVRELSVFFYGDGQWKNKRSAVGAAMKDARIARRTNGRNCKMVVVSVEDGLHLPVIEWSRMLLTRPGTI
jgi:hypothetical protein